MLAHTDKTEEQFGKTATAYLTSAVHRQGPDLAALPEMFAESADAAVLDLGCGAGHLSFTVAPHVRSVTAYDLSSEMLAIVAAEAERRNLGNIATVRGRVQELPFADGIFDWVCTRYSAHHWLEIDQAIREIHRVLKPGGSFVVIDTSSPVPPLLDTHIQALDLFRDGSHVRNYSFPEWTSHAGSPRLPDQGTYLLENSYRAQGLGRTDADAVPARGRPALPPEESAAGGSELFSDCRRRLLSIRLSAHRGKTTP